MVNAYSEAMEERKRKWNNYDLLMMQDEMWIIYYVCTVVEKIENKINELRKGPTLKKKKKKKLVITYWWVVTYT